MKKKTFSMQFLRPVMFIRPPVGFHKQVSLYHSVGRCGNNLLFSYQKTKNICEISLLRLNLKKKFVSSIIRRNLSKNGENTNVKNTGNFSAAKIKQLFSLAKPEKWKLVGAVCFLVMSSGITMALPFSFGKIIDIIYTNDPVKMRENLTKISTLLIGIFLLGACCNFGRIYLIGIAGQNITKSLRQKLFSSILKQEVAFFDKTKTGELINRLSADASLVSHSLTTNISDGLRSAITVMAGVGIMFYMSPRLSVVGLCVVPVIAILVLKYGRFVKKITKDVQDSLASATSVAEEKISNIRTVKAFTNEKREVELYDRKLQDVLKLAYKEALARGTFFGLTGFSGNMIFLTVLYYGGVLVSENTMTIGNLTSFLVYAVYTGLSVSGLGNFYSELNKSLGASIRLWEVIERVPDTPLSGINIPKKEPKGRILFENISFSYPTRKDCPVLQNLNLEIPEGSITSIVGSSGSGKSTIASILLRLYYPDEGSIYLDGINVEDLSDEYIRKHVGFVSQEPVLFSGSIRENIVYGAPDPSSVTDDYLIQIAQEANCYDFIKKSFVKGFDTMVGERGVMLSGGQKQRIAIARALIKNPRILLLDEATSALDAESEHLVQESLEKIMKGRTVLIIAHRLSSIKNSDQIVVLDKGSIVEKGTYQQLKKLEEGTFNKLIKHQTFA